MEIHIHSNATAKDYLFNGKCFLDASRRCYADENWNIMLDDKLLQLSVPTVVNASFACEMFFKALLIFENKDYPKNRDGHNLLKLYELLSPENRHAVSYFHLKTDDSDEKLKAFLVNHAIDFTEVRYYMENKGFSNMSPMQMWAFATNLYTITNHIIINSKTETGEGKNEG